MFYFSAFINSDTWKEWREGIFEEFTDLVPLLKLVSLNLDQLNEHYHLCLDLKV